MSEWRVESWVIFGETYCRVYREVSDEYPFREYSGGIFESETLAQEYADKLNRERRQDARNDT
ncbi:MAG: hypothetical protein IJT41_05150 [Clostridia bacterium]|nr:hypothetical protein [Clostridia bacterium]